jgi:sugar phosphate isomerase/epimerase
MRTALSSAAAPRATLDDLLAALTRHGLASVELRMGDGHALDVTSSPDALNAAADALRAAQVRVAALLDDHGVPTEFAMRAVRALDTQLVIGTAASLYERLQRADAARAAKVPVAVLVGGRQADADARVVRAAGHRVVWEAHPDDAPLAEVCDRVIAASADALVGVRVCGGGPEGSLHEGRGIGALMARLAVAGFDGALILAPSDRKYHLLWESWLHRHGGWGCGSRAADPVERVRRTVPMMEEIA